MTDDSIFRDRTVEAAARQIALVLAFLVESNLESLALLESGKRTTRAQSIKNQREIIERVIHHCVDLNISPVGFWGDACPRMKAAMDEHLALKEPTR